MSSPHPHQLNKDGINGLNYSKSAGQHSILVTVTLIICRTLHTANITTISEIFGLIKENCKRPDCLSLPLTMLTKYLYGMLLHICTNHQRKKEES